MRPIVKFRGLTLHYATDITAYLACVEERFSKVYRRHRVHRTSGYAALAIGLVIGGCGSGGSQSPSGSTNSPPTISGTPPATVLAGQAYSFTPSASDPDGDSLTFSVSNQPSWANFDSNSGELSGTPTIGDVGNYSDVSISVSDGQATASLPMFSVTVDQSGASSATLSWTAPSMNNDGSPLTDLAGYNIYYGTSSRNYTNQIVVNNPGVTTFVVDNLNPDTYYFAATAVNSGGTESGYSAEAIKTVN